MLNNICNFFICFQISIRYMHSMGLKPYQVSPGIPTFPHSSDCLQYLRKVRLKFPTQTMMKRDVNKIQKRIKYWNNLRLFWQWSWQDVISEIKSWIRKRICVLREIITQETPTSLTWSKSLCAAQDVCSSLPLHFCTHTVLAWIWSSKFATKILGFVSDFAHWTTYSI